MHCKLRTDVQTHFNLNVQVAEHICFSALQQFPNLRRFTGGPWRVADEGGPVQVARSALHWVVLCVRVNQKGSWWGWPSAGSPTCIVLWLCMPVAHGGSWWGWPIAGNPTVHHKPCTFVHSLCCSVSFSFTLFSNTKEHIRFPANYGQIHKLVTYPDIWALKNTH